MMTRLLMVLAVLLVGCGPVQNDFDEKVWRASTDSSDPKNPRGKMYESLKRKLLTERPTKEEVLALLGPPNWPEKDGRIGYILGAWSAFGVDFDSMYIHFDQSRRVDQVNWVQH